MGIETAAIIAAAAAAIPALYGVGKDIFGPGQGDIDAAGAQKIANMQKAGGAIGAYRPDQADARMKGMAQQLSAYQGAGNMMQAMYGGAGGAGGNGGIGTGGTFIPGQGGYNQWDPDSGTYKTGAPKVDPWAGTGFKNQQEYDAWKAYDRANKPDIKQPNGNGGTTSTPPILAPGTGSGAGGTMPGSSGTHLVDPTLETSLMGPSNQSMAAMLAKQGRY
jgi:hypothetical protein